MKQERIIDTRLVVYEFFPVFYDFSLPPVPLSRRAGAKTRLTKEAKKTTIHAACRHSVPKELHKGGDEDRYPHQRQSQSRRNSTTESHTHTQLRVRQFLKKYRTSKALCPIPTSTAQYRRMNDVVQIFMYWHSEIKKYFGDTSVLCFPGYIFYCPQ